MRQIFGKFLNIHSNEGIKLNESFSDSRYENLLKEGFLGTDSFYSDTLSSFSESEDNFDKELEMTHQSPPFPPPPQPLLQDYDHHYAFQLRGGILLPTRSDFEIDSFNEKDFNFNGNSPIKHDIFSKRDESQNVIEKKASINKKNNIKKENKNSTPNETPKKKCLGRKRKEEAVSQPDSSSHSMYKDDNISVKIQRHFFNFIICFLNCLLLHFNYNKKLSKLSKEVKLNIKKKNLKKNIDSLNDKTIGYIVSNSISEKYKSIDINSNKNICEQMKNNPKLNKILSENYLTFFKKFYYSSDSYANILRDYEIDITYKIFTENVKNFDALLKANEKKGNMYITSIKKVVQEKYLPDSIFMVNLSRKLFS